VGRRIEERRLIGNGGQWEWWRNDSGLKGHEKDRFLMSLVDRYKGKALKGPRAEEG
jgi:hypothetical protein